MTLRLQIISRHRQNLAERGVKEFSRDGGTIGRSLESDWVLPDGQRYISSRHASIDFRSGSYYIVDTSTNGVYVNDSEQPVGRGNPQRLFSGDRIRLGEYEMAVEIEEADNTAQQLADVNHIDPVVRAQRVPPPDPTRADLIQPHEITAVGIEMLIQEEAQPSQVRNAAKLAAESLRLEPEPSPAKHAAPAPAGRQGPPPVSAAARVSTNPAKAQAAPTAKPAPPKAPVSPAKEAVAPAAPTNGSTASAELDAFFRGAGLPAQKLDDKQAEKAMHRLGQLMREMILGLGENLHVRADQKTALRIPNTTIQPQNNNPLKFSASVDEALTNLLFRETSEYLPAVEAVREAFADVKQHQQVLLAALRIAVSDYIGRLDPEDLENKFTNGKRGGLMSAAHKLKYWDLYKDLYQVVTQSQQGHMPQQFLEEMARAYESESARTGATAASSRKSHAKAG